MVAVLSLVFAVASAAVVAMLPTQLSSGGWLVEGSESAQVSERLANDFGTGRSSIVVLFDAGSADAGSEAVQDAVESSLAGLASQPRVERVITYRSAGADPRFVSFDRRYTYAVVRLDATDEESIDLVDDIRAQIATPAGLSFRLTGYGPLALDANLQSEVDLRRAELVSLPLALVILVLVFATLVAAGLPLLVASLAIPTTLALVYAVAQVSEMSIYVVNVATMLGLALAIDYSLFLVSRFREELARGREVGDAVEITVATAGKAVAFSGAAVAVGLLSLLFFEAAAIASIGIGGSLVVLCSVVYALTFLPAVLGMLGPRVDALSFGGAIERLRRRLGLAPAEGRAASRWEGVARWVMRRPIGVLVPTLLLLLLAGVPFLSLSQAVPDAAVLPAGLESRDAYVTMRDEFPGGTSVPYVILAETSGDPLSAESIERLRDYSARAAALPGVNEVESAFDHPALVDPATGRPLDSTQLAQLFAAPPASLPPPVLALRDALLDQFVAGNTVRIDALSPLAPSDPDSRRLTEDLRALEPGPGVTTQVGGISASSHDTLASMSARTPWAVVMTMVVIAIVLFLLFGSVLLPIKAVLMTLLSITASFGALVWIFQEGNLAGLLDFEPLGYTIAGNPIIMFAVLFGLSMDYEVLLLSRVQEAYARTGDNTASVAEGLARTAAVITGAGMIMVIVFAAFALAETITIKSIGVGMAIAVFLDATIIRVLLVPATMRLMGRWNWWAPGPLRRIADRAGFSHVERPAPADEPPVLAPAGSP